MVLSDLVSLAQTLFPYLFERYGFKLVHSREGSKTQYRRYEVGVQSSMRIAFLYEDPSVAAVVLGTKQDDFDKVGEWVDARRLLDYIQKGPLRWKPPHEAGVDYVRASFSTLAMELEPSMPKVLEMFRSAENVADWRSGFDDYVSAEIARQYGLQKHNSSQ